MQKISPFLWFNDEAEEAAELYTSIFKNSNIKSIMPGPEGNVMGVTFELEGVEFMALNGGPQFEFNEAVSFYVRCKDQAEVDYYWDKLTADGGQESKCGWLKDKFGLSWQIIPERLEELMTNQAAVKAMLGMQKIIVKDIEAAAKKG